MPADPDPKLARRSLLTDQTAQCLQERIRLHNWRHGLPSEAVLCREFQVSRVTLRRALDQLVRSGLIIPGGRGVHHRVNPEAELGPAPAPGGKVIRVLAPFSLWKMGAVSHSILDALSQRISPAGLRVEFESRLRLFQRNEPREFERLLTLPDTLGWVLVFATESMQKWFEKQKLPCVVAGQLHGNLKLSCVYPDNVAVARHAAGLLVSRGHRRIACLTAKMTSHGDRLAASAFALEVRKLGAQVEPHEYEGTPESISRAMNFVIGARPTPTACYLTCPEDSVRALCHALHAGVTVPEQMEFLVGFDDPILDYTVPNLAHYAFASSAMGRKIGDVLLDHIANPGRLPTESAIMADFVPGGTLPARRKS
jgi:LacI family transcriptional regulator